MVLLSECIKYEVGLFTYFLHALEMAKRSFKSVYVTLFFLILGQVFPTARWTMRVNLCPWVGTLFSRESNLSSIGHQPFWVDWTKFRLFLTIRSACAIDAGPSDLLHVAQTSHFTVSSCTSLIFHSPNSEQIWVGSTNFRVCISQFSLVLSPNRQVSILQIPNGSESEQIWAAHLLLPFSSNRSLSRWISK